MAQTKPTNIGEASHMGEKKIPLESHFIYDYVFRRVPIPILSYMAIADSEVTHLSKEIASKIALDCLREQIEPAAIAEEECDSRHMEKLIRESLKNVNEKLFNLAQNEENPQTRYASLTFVLASKKRAYIGHVGDGRIYLMHDEKLFDLTPTGELSGSSTEETPTLFSLPAGEEETSGHPAPFGKYLGETSEILVGYNEVEITPGDVIVLASDGLWKSVPEEEIIENLTNALNVQRSASQLVRLAFSRNSDENATMLAWQYVLPGQEFGLSEHEIQSRERKEKAVDTLLVLLLSLILLAIFSIGVALGWRITDAFRKPQKESRKVENRKETTVAEKKASKQENVENSAPSSSGPLSIRLAKVKGEGVRMRATADPNGDIVGLVRNGESVEVLGSTIGTDSMTWTKARGKVRSAGKEIEAEGYIRNDFLIQPSE
ncbi:MAG: protein phosphatase 2C domain-containing protein [Actinomycetota bacterium]|nr:protein phosphatase 2C domain-containing protein [Actinomycetota bacterium]